MEQKLLPPLTFKTLTVDNAKRGTGTVQAVVAKTSDMVCDCFAKLTFWKTATTCLAVYSLTDSSFEP